MLAIRMQRTGRKGHAMFRMVVQDSRLTPTSGKVVARLGSYDPHAKALIVDKEKASFYLDHGAQPSERVARLLKAEGVKLPDWVKFAADKERTIRNADKRRSTRPAEPVAAEEEAPAAEPETAAASAEAVPETETPAVEAPKAEESSTEETIPAEEKAADEPAAPEEPAADDTAKEAETPEEAPAEEPEPVADEAKAADKEDK